jgi:Protein of unknown function (DUF3551)
MRKLLIAMAALAVAGIATVTTSAQAASYDYPWCVFAKGWEYPGECAYQNYAQCMATASGRFAYCVENPRVAFARARRGRNPYLNY